MLDPAELPRRMAQLSAQYPMTDPEMVEGVVRAVLTSMRGDLSAKETALLDEVEELAQTLANARAEIAALDAGDINDSHIPSATDELDAIVAHTAVATDNILECCEKLDALAPTLTGEAARVVQEVTTAVYEACSFQDITGQRITKIVATLQSIEHKVSHIIDVFGRGQAGGAGGAGDRGRGDQGLGNKGPGCKGLGDNGLGDNGVAVSGPASLLNGPQLPAAAMDQSTIDALLASFD